RFEKSGERGELDSSTFHGRIALGLCSEDYLDRSGILNVLCDSLYRRFERYGKLEDLEEVVKHHYAALELRPIGHPDRSRSLSNLAVSLHTRFEQYGRTADIDEAIKHHHTALQLRPDGHPDRFASLSNLAGAITTRFQRHGRTADLDDAIEHLRIALQLAPEDDPNRSIPLNNLAGSLHSRFKQHGRTSDIDEAIEHYRAAVQLLPNGHFSCPVSLNNLALCLQLRFEQHGWTRDIDEAISHYRAALKLFPDGHPNRSEALGNLAISLRSRFGQHGKSADLDEAVKHHRTVLQLLSNRHPNRFMSLNNLACSLQHSFERNGQAADLDEAIELNRAALQLFPNDHPDLSMPLNNLAELLCTRFEQIGQTADLDEAIKHHRTALELRPDGHPNRPRTLGNLAKSLSIRFQQHGQTADLDEAIEHHHAALRLRPDSHPGHSVLLNNFAADLRSRFYQYGQTIDINEAIEHHRAALQLCPDSHPNRPGSLNNLAADLRARFDQDGQTTDINEAIEHHCTALHLCPDGHPEHSGSLRNYAASLLSRFVKSGFTDDFETCVRSLERAAEHKFSGIAVRLASAVMWANVARNHAHHTTSRAYKVALLLLQRAVTVSPTLHTQCNFFKRKRNYGTLALDAVAYAVDGNRLEEAIEIGEQGRGLLWLQMRNFRAPLDDLAETNRELAERFKSVSRRLENLVTSSTEFQSKHLSLEQEDIIHEIRRIPGFQGFLAATPFKVLQQAALEGPVVVVNRCKYRSDALIVLSREDMPVVCVPLDRQFYKDSTTLSVELLATRQVFKAGSPEYNEKLIEAMKMLWDRIVSKVVSKLKELGIGEGARIWWCPTSILSALPFHAAGPFKDAGGTIKYILDEYVSSYTPTLGALIKARSRDETTDKACREDDPTMLIVADTKTLKYTRSEVRAVRNNTRSYVSSHKLFLDGKALRKTVIEGLQDVTWIHFACHGHLGSGSLDSSFRLSDKGLTLLDIMRVNLPNAEFAFLSACHTAEQHGIGPSLGTYDEVLHLAAAVQFCGFRSVIGTMWEMYDPDGPLLARDVYSYMADYEDGEVIHKRSAAALRNAVLALRKEDVQTERWVNLVHIGA
ncbi:uncharacterized protein FOMMEDRAFT_95233, partial [Fomitiporia mediterranea MF3/22]|uniref:uncharacterized protein n=1 Tax=Fomitiporia mediterranea (strain MF3/22) TaxID=694068 RepID=UPI0004407761